MSALLFNMRKILFFIVFFNTLNLWGNSGYFAVQEGSETYLAYKVSVIGEVKTSGEYILKDGDKLSDLISKCGGFSGKANIKDIIIIRNEKTIKINFYDFLKNANEKDNPKLFPGDYVIVKRSVWSYFLTGMDVLYKMALTINTIIIAYMYISNN